MGQASDRMSLRGFSKVNIEYSLSQASMAGTKSHTWLDGMVQKGFVFSQRVCAGQFYLTRHKPELSASREPIEKMLP